MCFSCMPILTRLHGRYCGITFHARERVMGKYKYVTFMESSQITSCSICKQPSCDQLAFIRRSLLRVHIFVAKLRQTLSGSNPFQLPIIIILSCWTRALSITLCALKENATTTP